MAPTLMDPALSPDGKRIAFMRQEPVKNLGGGQIDFGTDLYVVNRDGSGLKEIVHHSALAEYVRDAVLARRRPAFLQRPRPHRAGARRLPRRAHRPA